MFATTVLWIFSKMRGAAAMTVGLTTPRLSAILSRRPSITVGTPMPIITTSSSLPNECDSGSHRKCRSDGEISSISRTAPAA